MGRLTHETTIQHFSHPHPLHLTSTASDQLIPLSCAACTLPCASTWIYTCNPCRFHLHVDPCSGLPPLIHHASHPPHTLTLLPRPPYPEGCFDCDACGRTGTGFCYHCPACALDLHTGCASVPLSVRHHAHPHHPLTLAFHPPYDNKGFSCDVCGSLGGNHWLYRCALCEFDVHLGCGVRAGPGPVARSASLPQGMVAQAQPAAGVISRMGSTGGLMRQVVGGLLDGATQQIGQNLVNGFTGSGGGGDASGGGDGGGGGGSVMDIGSAILGSVLGGGGSTEHS